VGLLLTDWWPRYRNIHGKLTAFAYTPKRHLFIPVRHYDVIMADALDETHAVWGGAPPAWFHLFSKLPTICGLVVQYMGYGLDPTCPTNSLV
jgi:hypothetical protein